MQTWMAVGLGGALGSMLRHAAGIVVTRVAGTPVPHATAFVNVTGCLIIGLLAGLIAGDVLRVGDGTRAFLFAGLLGGFTTFSSFGLDTLTLVKAGAAATALVNAAVQVGGGLAAVFLGFACAQFFSR